MSDSDFKKAVQSSRAVEVQASAPGRVNLIGEHTDYNDGFVLPYPIPQETRVGLTPRPDLDVYVQSAEQTGPGNYTLGTELRRGDWLDYVQGVTAVLRKTGHSIRGFDARVSSTVPMGAGLSSSAALEVALLRALRSAFSLELDDLAIAKLGQAAEVDFVGVPIGIMDQMASSLGRPGSALFIDTRSLATREVTIPDALELVVIASGVTHAHGTGEYSNRRKDCEAAARALGVHSLRDATLSDLAAHAELDAVLRRRARHVISENERVLQTVDALAQGDLARLSYLFAASHASMRDDYEVSVSEIDLLVDLAIQESGVVAARMTGGGFGGSVVILARAGSGGVAAQKICRQYKLRTGTNATTLLPRGRGEDAPS